MNGQDAFADLLPRWLRHAAELDEALLAELAARLEAARADVARQYRNWFVETADAWALPLIGELVGYRTQAGYRRVPTDGLRDGGPAADAARRLAAALAPRRDVAGTVAYRRRKGTLPLLEELSGWPARAVETSRLLAQAPPVRLHRPGRELRGRLADLRDGGALDLAGTPFETAARTVDVRGGTGVRLHVWRLKACPVTRAPAHRVAAHLLTFSALGNDTPLVAGADPPAFLRRRQLADGLPDHYGPGGSVAVWRGDVPVPASDIVVADLADWHYRPRRDQVAIDPERGRLAFGAHSAPEEEVRVSYHYAAAADLGGGEYPRDTPTPGTVYRVGPGQPYRRIADALRRWREERPDEAVIEIADSGAYREELAFELGAEQRLTLRAADGARPVLDLADPLGIRVAPDCPAAGRPRLTLDGLLVTGRGVHVRGPLGALALRHSTLVPGWSLAPHCAPTAPGEPSLLLERTTAAVHIDRSILGAVLVLGDRAGDDPLPIRLRDSVLDATGPDRPALTGVDGGHAHAELHAHRATVLGEIHTHAVRDAADTIFAGRLHVARRQLGRLRHCWLPDGSRTPRRVHCHSGLPHPVFADTRYGTPGYARLADGCPARIARGAEDGAEMGVFHDLYQPQRLDSLRARLAEYTPAGTDAAILFAT